MFGALLILVTIIRTTCSFECQLFIVPEQNKKSAFIFNTYLCSCISLTGRLKKTREHK